MDTHEEIMTCEHKSGNGLKAEKNGILLMYFRKKAGQSAEGPKKVLKDALSLKV